ncbi:MAG: hypothetical protein J6Q51_01250 [Clostridia bacterium]|nr:hypothetical protein [Clostridia bacterium]
MLKYQTVSVILTIKVEIMDRYDLYKFVRDFNAMGGVPQDAIFEGLKTLPKKDHELFITLVNYKNGKDFAQKLKKGEI